MKLFVDAIEFIAFGAIVVELHLGFAVTVYTPSHAQVRHLLYLVHGLHFAVAALALHLAGIYVLGVAEINVVRQIVNLDPLDRLGHGRIPLVRFIRIESGKLIQLLDLGRTINLISFFVEKLGAFLIGLNGLMAIHTGIHRGNGSMLALLCTTMAIQTVDLVDTGMHLV